MSFVILARCGSSTFFMTELCGGVLMLASSWPAMTRFGLDGLGFAFMLTTAIYCLLCWCILRRNLGLRWARENTLLFLTFVVAMLVVRVLPYAGMEHLRTPIALLLATLTGLRSLHVISNEVGGVRQLLAWGRGKMRASGG